MKPILGGNAGAAAQESVQSKVGIGTGRAPTAGVFVFFHTTIYHKGT